LGFREIFARHFDHVFVAQRDYVTGIAASGHSGVRWLPSAGDPGLHFVRGLPRDIDVGFVGKHGAPGTERHRVLTEVLGRFRTNPQDRSYTPQEMGVIYSRSRIVFNKSIGGDVNMRVFEAMAAGALLVTDRIGNGLDELAEEGTHYIGYDTADEAVAQIRRYLEDEDGRARIARQGRELLLARHSYAARLREILAAVAVAPPHGAPARGASARERRLWRAEWARLRGTSLGQALSLGVAGLPAAGYVHLAIGLARGARQRLSRR